VHQLSEATFQVKGFHSKQTFILLPSWSVEDSVVLTAFEWSLGKLAVMISASKLQCNTLKGATSGQMSGKTCIQSSNLSPQKPNIIKTDNFGCSGFFGALLGTLPWEFTSSYGVFANILFLCPFSLGKKEIITVFPYTHCLYVL